MVLARPLAFAVFAELVHSVAVVVSAIQSGHAIFIQGAAGRFVLIGSLAAIALLKRRRWARWTLAGCEYAAALGLLVAGLASKGGIDGPLLAYIMFFVAVGIAASVRQVPSDSPARNRESTTIGHRDVATEIRA